MLSLILAVALAAAPKTAAAKQETMLVISVKPAQVIIFLDGRKLGTAAKEYKLKVTPGDHHIKLQLKKDSSEEIVSVKKGQKRAWSFDMTDSGDPGAKPKQDGPSQESQLALPPAHEQAAPPPPPPSRSEPESDPDLNPR
jgi:hypothetical protein